MQWEHFSWYYTANGTWEILFICKVCLVCSLWASSSTFLVTAAGVSLVMPLSAAAISDFSIHLHVDYHCYNNSSEIIRNDKHVCYALTLSSEWILLGQNSTIHSAKFFTFCLIPSPVVILFFCGFSPRNSLIIHV